LARQDRFELSVNAPGAWTVVENMSSQSRLIKPRRYAAGRRIESRMANGKAPLAASLFAIRYVAIRP